MQAAYRRDINHNYLILSEEGEVEKDSYQIRILVSNPPQGLLRCRLQTVDNQVQFYYDITSRQSMTSIYEHSKIKREELSLLFGDLIRVVEEMEAYLLETDHLLLHPEYIFLDSERQNVYFCFFLMHSQDTGSMFREIAEYLLPKIDHTDQAAVILGYSIYRRTMEDAVYIEQIKGELYQEAPKPSFEPELFSQEEEEEMGSAQDEVLQMFSETEEEKEMLHPVVHTIGIAAAGLVFLGYIYFLNNSIYSWKVYAIVTAIIVAAAVVPLVIYQIQKRRSSKAEREPEQKSPDILEEPALDIDVERQKDDEDFMRIKEESEKGADGETMILAPTKQKRYPCLTGVYPSILEPVLINKNILILGKLDSVSDVVLPSPAVSRIHAKIVKEDDYILYDLNSRNGTFLNHQIINSNERYELKDGDEITFGDLTYCFRSN